MPVHRGQCTGIRGIRGIDATALAVWHAARIQPHRVFRVDARRGKPAVGWCAGFKLPVVVNERGELLAGCLTPGHLEDRKPVPRLARRLFGRLFGDQGDSAAPLAERLFLAHGLRRITNLRKHMRNALLPCADTVLLRKRALSATIVDQLKNICQIEPSRHRSPYHCLVHLLAGLVASCHQPKKPSLGLDLHRRLAASLIPN